MKKIPLTWIAVLLALLPIGYLFFLLPSLPQTVPVHFGIDMKADRIGPKSELWLATVILSAVSVFVYFLLTNLYRIDPKRKDAAQSALFQKLAIGLVVFLTVLNLLLISAAKSGSNTQGFLLPLIGLFFAFVGNYLNHIKPNYFAGIRLPWTLSNDENWRRTHQLGGKLWFAGGLLIAIVCLFLPPVASFIFFVSVMVVMVIVPIVYSYLLFKKGL